MLKSSSRASQRLLNKPKARSHHQKWQSKVAELDQIAAAARTEQGRSFVDLIFYRSATGKRATKTGSGRRRFRRAC
jgi:hypothetical protein